LSDTKKLTSFEHKKVLDQKRLLSDLHRDRSSKSATSLRLLPPKCLSTSCRLA